MANPKKGERRRSPTRKKKAGARLSDLLGVPLTADQRAWVQDQADADDRAAAVWARRRILKGYPGPGAWGADGEDAPEGASSAPGGRHMSTA